jgi:hypothetical protein
MGKNSKIILLQQVWIGNLCPKFTLKIGNLWHAKWFDDHKTLEFQWNSKLSGFLSLLWGI